MRKILFCFFMAIILIAALAAEGRIITTGIGPSQREALMAAQRKAVEQGVGVLMDSQSLSKNLMLVEDNIYAKSRGYVKDYTVIAEKKMGDGNWKVTIECQVAEEKIKNSLKALGILRDKMGNPRVMVSYDAKITDAVLPGNHPVVSEAYEGIVQHLAEREFPVVDRKTAQPGLKEKAEYILVYTVKAVDQEAAGIFKKVWVMISAKIINTSTGLVIANQVKKVIGVDKESKDFAYRKAARKAGQLVARFLEDKVVKKWGGETVSGRAVVLEMVNIRNFSLLVEFKSRLNKAYGVRNVLQRHSTARTAEYEITYVGDTGTLKESVYAILKKMGLKAGFPISSGDRIRVELIK